MSRKTGPSILELVFFNDNLKDVAFQGFAPTASS